MTARNIFVIVLLVLWSCVLVGCDKPVPEPEPKTATIAAEPAPKPPPKKVEEPLPPAPKKLVEPDKANEKAPATFKAKFETSKGDFVVEVHRAWAPLGADRFYNLVKRGFFDDVIFFRVKKGFVVQWGIHGHPDVSAKWRHATIKDEKVKESNKRGYITFAKGGKDSRTTQVFINYKDNKRLDGMGFPPFGKVVEGMKVVDELYGGYGGAPSDRQPDIQSKGNRFLKKAYPKLDYIKKATLVKK